MNAGDTGDSLIVLWDSSLLVLVQLFPLAAYDSHTNCLLLCSGKSEMFSFPLSAAGGTGNLMSKPQLTCVLDVTGSLVRSLDCVDTSTVDPARKTTIKNKFISLTKVHSNLDWLTEWLRVRGLAAPMHLGLYWQDLCAPLHFKGALSLYQSSRWPQDLYSWCPLAPRRRSPDAYAWVKPRLHTDKEYGPNFHPLLHTSYTVGCLSAALSGDVCLGYNVRWRDL
jgi:hypothetical protein